VVTPSASEVDLDVFGADFGDGVPVAAFAIRKTKSDCCLDYAIYSLHPPPHLLLTISGGGSFSASDIDLDGTVEIFTDDSAVVNGFESISLGELNFLPTLVLRFVHGLWKDGSAEFQPYFDRQIAKIREGLSSQDLQSFKNSDGKLTQLASEASAERLHELRTAKIKVLEIVWAYLYSGREDEAWRFLRSAWPPGDVERIRSAILNMRSRGIQSQVDGVLTPAPRKKKHAQIFDSLTTSEVASPSDIVPPEAILLQVPPTADQTPSDLLLELVIDRVGKVRAAQLAGKKQTAHPELFSAALTWKFIPAFRNGKAVASRLRIAVSPKQ
jgi:hypothetical protein